MTSGSLSNDSIRNAILHPTGAPSIKTNTDSLVASAVTNTAAFNEIVTQLTVANSAAKTDGFGRARVSNPQSVFEGNTVTKERKGSWYSALVTGSGGVTDNGSYHVLEASGPNTQLLRQSRYYMQYQPGKSFFILLSGRHASAANLLSRMGLYDDDDGYFFEMDNGTLYAVERAYGSDTRVAQSAFSLDTGAAFDFTGRNLFFIEWEWLGVGCVTMGAVNVDRELTYLHRFNHIGDAVGKPYTSRASLPVRYELVTNGSYSGTDSLVSICSTCISEGGYTPRGLNFSVARIASPVIVAAGSQLPFIAVRARADRPRVLLNPLRAEVATGDNTLVAVCRMYLIRNNTITLTGGSGWQSFTSPVTASESAAEYHITATGYTGSLSDPDVDLVGTFMITDSGGNSLADVNQFLVTGSTPGAVADIILLTLEAQAGQTGPCVGCLSWQEIE